MVSMLLVTTASFAGASTLSVLPRNFSDGSFGLSAFNPDFKYFGLHFSSALSAPSTKGLCSMGLLWSDSGGSDASGAFASVIPMSRPGFAGEVTSVDETSMVESDVEEEEEEERAGPEAESGGSRRLRLRPRNKGLVPSSQASSALPSLFSCL